MKFNKLILILIISTCLILSGCSETNSTESPEVEEQELNIYNWEDYFGETTVEDFEEEFGIKVNLETYDDEEALFAALQSDPTRYDLVFPSDDLSNQLIQLHLLAEIDHENIPNLENIYDKYLGLPHDPDNFYTAPYAWGTTGIVYNPKYVAEEDITDSWDMMFNPKYEGKIADLDSPYVTVAITLKSLGYSLNSDEISELEEVRQRLLAQKEYVAGYIDVISMADMMVAEEIWIAPIYSGDVWAAIEENPDLEYFVPSEGSDIYFDMMAIPIGAKNKDNAEKFINYVLRPEVHALITDYTGYGNPNKQSHELGLIDEEQLASPIVYPPEEIMDLLETWDTEESSERTAMINQIWSELEAE